MTKDWKKRWQKTTADGAQKNWQSAGLFVTLSWIENWTRKEGKVALKDISGMK